MPFATRSLLPLLLAFASLLSVGCRAQVPPAASSALSPELARRVEILIRNRTKIPPDYILTIGPRAHSDIPGFDEITVTFAQSGSPARPITFLLSKDGNTLAQFSRYDISHDPKTVISGAGRPARGGPASAPVEIVAFDDLECPYCARMHAQLFPALIQRYGDNVRIVYRDYPLSIHPWAMRAAIDTNCLAPQSSTAYWSLVDTIHAQASQLGGADRSVVKANQSLDEMTLEQARKDKLKLEPIEACVKKQDEAPIRESMKLGEDLDIGATPVLFINGEKLEGAYPLTDVFRMVDGALVAAGKTPPPTYVAPAAPAAVPRS